MKYFHYIIKDDEVAESKGEVKSVPADFLECPATLSGLKVYYKIVNSKITDAIGEAIHEDAARGRVDEFLSAFLATPFESL